MLAFGAGQGQATSPFDGVYKGASTHNGGSSGANAKCEDKIAFSVTVRDGTFEWRGGREATKVTVGPDGAFAAQSGRRFLAGSIANGKTTGTTPGG